MNTETKKVTATTLKRELSAKMKSVERDFMTAKNEFYTVIALDKFIVIIRSELENWFKLIAEKTEASDSTLDLTIKEAAEHVESLNRMLGMFITERNTHIEKALAIQLAMINGHKLASPAIMTES